jgi:parallel beta-helix repeat protein
MKWKYNLTVLLALIMMGTGMLSTIGDAGVNAYPESSRAPLIPHAPIHIYNNFSTKAFQEGWSGTGVTGDPYVIEGLEIDASGHSWGIFIGQTDEHFVIRNCVIKIADTTSSPQYRGDNIYLTSVSNGTLVGNDILDSEFTPVMIRYCNNISVLDNNISGSNRSNGIYSWRSKDILIKNNRIAMNANIGISVSSSEDLIIANNSINDSRERSRCK